jgi:predicted enzyme related to lactoylglutathione lyase
MSISNHIDYIELPTSNLEASKTFFQDVFAWSFTDFGDEYAAFKNAGVDGGFYQSDLVVAADKGSALIVLYSANLEDTQRNIEGAGGKIHKSIFAFPGGKRFHFIDPSGNEFAVWSDK